MIFILGLRARYEEENQKFYDTKEKKKKILM